MEYGKLVGDSFTYAKEGLVGHYGKWIILIILSVIPAIPIMLGVILGFLTLMSSPATLVAVLGIAIIIAVILAFPLLGYMVLIYKGEKPAPEVANWGALFSNGLKLFIVHLIYAIPVLIIAAVVLGSTLLTVILSASQSVTNPQSMMGLIGALIFGFIILLIVAFIIWIIEAIAVVRFARTNSIGEAFNFGEIFARISKIGVGSYILALIIMAIIIGIIVVILEAIPFIGWFILLIVAPILTLFEARYLSLLYDSVA
jgi:hypothetical protein